VTLGLGLGSDSGDGGEELPGGVGGELPPGWAWATLEELCDVNPRAFDDEPSDDDFISQVPMASVEAETGRIDASHHARYGDLKKKSLTRFQENDVLFAKITPCMENGKIAVARGLLDGRALGSTEYHVLRSRGAVLPEYLMHYLLQPGVRVKAEQNMSGAVGQRRVPRPYLESLEVPVPPISEQYRIIAEIERQVSHIEAGETAVQSAQKTIESLWSSVLEWVAQARETTDIEQSQKKPVGKVATVSGGIQKSGKRRPVENTYPFLRVANVPRGHLDLSDVHEIELFDGEIERHRISFGDLLVVEGNGSPEQIGRAAMWRDEIRDCVHQNHLIRVRPGEELIPEYLELVWNAPSTAAQLRAVAASTSGLYTLSTAKVKNVEISIPPLREQKILIRKARESREMIDSAAVIVFEAAAQARDLRTALLYAAFTGALVPQDPADEPASALLDRIRAARVTAKAAPRKRIPRKPRPAPPGQGELPE
jgi:type I restriction enzyme S subunit